jgi:hypothetical protein
MCRALASVRCDPTCQRTDRTPVRLTDTWGGAGTATAGDMAACPAGSYSAELGASGCLRCQDNTTTAGPGAASASDCVCLPGYTYAPASGTCERTLQQAPLVRCAATAAACSPVVAGGPACPTDTYKPALGNHACLPCPNGTVTTGQGAASSALCVCRPGFGGLDCAACPQGTFKSTVASDACLSCPAGTSTIAAGATAASLCVCGPGAFDAAANGTTSSCTRTSSSWTNLGGECMQH